MNWIAALTVAMALFSLSALTAWMTRDEAAPGPRKAARGHAAVVKRGALPVRTPQDWRAQIEKNLTGSAGFARGPFSKEEFERLWKKSFEWGEEQNLSDYAEAWVRHDPAGARAWLESRLPDYGGGTDSESVSYKTSLIFDAWAKVDLEAALAAAPRLYQTNMRCQALICVLEVLWQSDPDRARTVYAQNLDVFARGNYFGFSIPAGEAGKRNLEFLQSLPPGKARANLLAVAMDGVARSGDRTAAASFWKTAPPELQREMLAAGFLSRRILRYWDPYTKEVLDAFPGVEDRRREQAEITRNPGDVQAVIFRHGASWAERDLPGLLSWVGQYEDRTNLELHVFRVASKGQFDTTLRFCQEMPESDLRYKAIGIIHKYANFVQQKQTGAIIDALTPAQKDLARRAAVN